MKRISIKQLNNRAEKRMSGSDKEQQKKALELEVGSLASGIINKASNNIAIKWTKCVKVINVVIQLLFFLTILGYVLLLYECVDNFVSVNRIFDQAQR